MVPVFSQIADHHPSPLELQQELPGVGEDAPESALVAVVRVIPELKVLTTEEEQTFWVAIEVEGILHNRRALSDLGIDVVLLIDNS
jgi:hypothetical protein